MEYKLHSKYGPIISDEESKVFYSDLKEIVSKGGTVSIDFSKVVAMSTKSAKRIFGNLYSSMGSEEFYNKIHIENASKTLQEIIYDSILNFVSNTLIEE